MVSSNTKSRLVSLPHIPLEIYSVIAYHLVPPEPSLAALSTKPSTEWKARMQTLQNLSQVSHSLRYLISPLLHNFIHIRSGYDIILLLVQLLRNPSLRKQVRHIYCDTTQSWAWEGEKGLKGSGKALWEKYFGNGLDLPTRLSELEYLWGPGDVAPPMEGEKIILGSGLAYDMDDILTLAFGGILALVPNLESLSLHREITKNGFMVDVKTVLEGTEAARPVLPNLKVVKLVEDKSIAWKTDTLPCLICFLLHYNRGEKIILSGVHDNFNVLTKTLVVEHEQSMPQIQELVLKPWITPVNLTSHINSVAAEIIGGYRPLQNLPKLFPKLRTLEVEFDTEPDPSFDLWSPLRLLSDTLEVLKLKRQKFPIELLRGPGMVKLRELILEDCSTFSKKPELWAVESVLGNCTNGYYMYFEHKSLEKIVVNGCGFRVIAKEEGPPDLAPL